MNCHLLTIKQVTHKEEVANIFPVCRERGKTMACYLFKHKKFQ